MKCGVLTISISVAVSFSAFFYGWSGFVIFLFACSTEGVADETVVGQKSTTLSALLSFLAVEADVQ